MQTAGSRPADPTYRQNLKKRTPAHRCTNLPPENRNQPTPSKVVAVRVLCLNFLLTKPSLRTLTQRLCLQKGFHRHMRPWLQFPTTANFLVRHLSATNIEKELRIRHQNTAKPQNKIHIKFLQYVAKSPVAREGELDSDLIPIEFDFQSYFIWYVHLRRFVTLNK